MIVNRLSAPKQGSYVAESTSCVFLVGILAAGLVFLLGREFPLALLAGSVLAYAPGIQIRLSLLHELLHAWGFGLPKIDLFVSKNRAEVYPDQWIRKPRYLGAVFLPGLLLGIIPVAAGMLLAGWPGAFLSGVGIAGIAKSAGDLILIRQALFQKGRYVREMQGKLESK